MFISEAYAQAASGAAAQPGGLESMFSSFGVMILIFAVFWFLLIRPQQKRQKEHKKMIDALTTGNEVITAGGICGKIVAAEKVAKTKKLMKLTIDTGIDTRTVVSGIAEYYTPEEVVGQQVSILVNLEPKQLKGIESQGMILMAENADGSLAFVRPDKEVKEGAEIR